MMCKTRSIYSYSKQIFLLEFEISNDKSIHYAFYVTTINKLHAEK